MSTNSLISPSAGVYFKRNVCFMVKTKQKRTFLIIHKVDFSKEHNSSVSVFYYAIY